MITGEVTGDLSKVAGSVTEFDPLSRFNNAISNPTALFLGGLKDKVKEKKNEIEQKAKDKVKSVEQEAKEKASQEVHKQWDNNKDKIHVSVDGLSLVETNATEFSTTDQSVTTTETA